MSEFLTTYNFVVFAAPLIGLIFYFVLRKALVDKSAEYKRKIANRGLVTMLIIMTAVVAKLTIFK